MSVTCVIPARMASRRFPGKVLALLHGKAMIKHVWERAKRSQKVSRIIIACDHKAILEACTRFGAEVVMTRSNHKSGSDRAAEVALSIQSDIIINLQADEPLVAPKLLDDLANALLKDASVQVATPVALLNDESDRLDPNCVKVVTDY